MKEGIWAKILIAVVFVGILVVGAWVFPWEVEGYVYSEGYYYAYSQGYYYAYSQASYANTWKTAVPACGATGTLTFATDTACTLTTRTQACR